MQSTPLQQDFWQNNTEKALMQNKLNQNLLTSNNLFVSFHDMTRGED